MRSATAAAAAGGSKLWARRAKPASFRFPWAEHEREAWLVVPVAFIVFAALFICGAFNAAYWSVCTEDTYNDPDTTCSSCHPTCIYGIIELIASTYSFVLVIVFMLFKGTLVTILGIGALLLEFATMLVGTVLQLLFPCNQSFPRAMTQVCLGIQWVAAGGALSVFAVIGITTCVRKHRNGERAHILSENVQGDNDTEAPKPASPCATEPQEVKVTNSRVARQVRHI
ncbi:hypothetical protein Pelo_438 [Pelomyxa schiedti]|nr:hypothetical protein Pelo_438 [Pelomyxa schiedti]